MTQVIDASVVVSALLDDSKLGAWCAQRMSDTSMVAPELLPFEVGNIIRRTVVRGALAPSDGVVALATLDQLTIDFVPFAGLWERAWRRRQNLTTYDASYVATAELFSCRLVTVDRRLADAPGLDCEVLVAP